MSMESTFRELSPIIPISDDHNDTPAGLPQDGLGLLLIP